MIEFIQHLINGLSYGSIYALIALGYTMVFGVLQLINFAHGDVFMLGAFIGYYTVTHFNLAHEPGIGPLLLTIFVAMAGCAAVGAFIEKFAYRPLRKFPRINVLITAIGVSLLLEFGGQVVFGAAPKVFPPVYQPESFWNFGELVLNPVQVMILGVSLTLMVILQTIVFKTRTGRAMRAVSFNHSLASLMGIPTDKVISWTFMLGSALAGAGGVLVGLAYSKIDPLMGVMPGLKAFIAAVLGGIGNVTGAVVGAICLGLAEELISSYLASSYRDAFAFGILIVVLLFKPSGLFGSSRLEKV